MKLTTEKNLKHPFILVLYFVLLLQGTYFSQKKEIDSLLVLEKKHVTKGDTIHIKLLNNLSSLYESIDLDSSLLLGQQALNYAIKINYKKGIAQSYTRIGYYYNAKGNYELSLDNFVKSKNIYEDIKNYDSYIETFNAIGNCYIGYGKVEKALESYLDGYNLSIEYKNIRRQAILGVGVGNCYIELKEYQKALEYLLVSQEIFVSINSMLHISFNKSCIANAQIGLGLYKEAFKNYDSAILILETLDNQYAIAATYQDVAKTYQSIKNYDKAIDFFQKAKVIFEDRKAYDNLKKISLALSECYYQKKQFEEAYLYHVAYSNYNDSIFNEKVSQQILEIEGKYKTEKQQQALEIQEVSLREKDAKLAEESLRSSLLYLVIGIVVLISIVAFIGYFVKRKNNTTLNIVNQNLEHKNKIIGEKTKEILDSINYAKNIQNAIIPPIETVKKYLPNSFILYLPKDIVAGDFYWIEKTANKLYFAVADCTGHGVPGALVSVVCSNALNRSIKEFNNTQTSAILDKTRDLVIETFINSLDNIKDGMDISFAALTLEQHNNNQTEEFTLDWSGANNPLWIVRKDATTIEELKGDKQPIGLSHISTPFKQHKITLQKGDSIYLFTDGFADQFGGVEKSGGKKFMYRRLKELILSIQDLPLKKQEEKLVSVLNKWKGEFEQLDDICIMGVRF